MVEIYYASILCKRIVFKMSVLFELFQRKALYKYILLFTLLIYRHMEM